MIRLLTFDVDGTLAPYLKRPEPRTVEALRKWQSDGWKLAFVSGKNVSYLQGFARALGLLEGAVLMGENALVIEDGEELKSCLLALRPRAYAELEHAVLEQFGDRVYYQPNAVAVSIFVKDYADTEEVRAFMDKFDVMHDPGTTVYLHPDRCTELIPAGYGKGRGLEFYMDYAGYKREEVLAAGDGMNDLEMLKAAGKAFLVGGRLDCPCAEVVPDPNALLEAIERCIR